MFDSAGEISHREGIKQVARTGVGSAPDHEHRSQRHASQSVDILFFLDPAAWASIKLAEETDLIESQAEGGSLGDKSADGDAPDCGRGFRHF
jgi:hypothetical protein